MQLLSLLLLTCGLVVVTLISTMDAKPILYSYWRSSCSYRVRIGLNLKGIAYEYRTIDLGPKSEHKNVTFEDLNPLKQIPAFIVKKDGKEHTLIQSVAILEFLNELYPEPQLLPGDEIQRANIRSIVETVASGIQPLQNPETLQLATNSSIEMNEFAKQIIAKKFVALETLLKKHSGEFCVGNQVSMADLFVVPQVYNARRYQVDLTPFPTITRLAARLEKIPAFAAALPERQPDCPADRKIN